MDSSSRLLEWCTARAVTLTDVSGLSGYSVAYLSLITRGKRVPPPHAKIAIARALHARVGDLFPPERAELSA